MLVSPSVLVDDRGDRTIMIAPKKGSWVFCWGKREVYKSKLYSPEFCLVFWVCVSLVIYLFNTMQSCVSLPAAVQGAITNDHKLTEATTIITPVQSSNPIFLTLVDCWEEKRNENGKIRNTRQTQHRHMLLAHNTTQRRFALVPMTKVTQVCRRRWMRTETH